MLAIDLGAVRIGIRANHPDLAGRVRALLAPHVVEDPDVGSNVDLVAGDDEGRTRRLHQAYCSGERVVRTASAGRLLRSLPLLLARYLEPPAGLVRLNAWTLVGPAGAVLVDRSLGEMLERLEGRLVRKGYRRRDASFADVDPQTAELVLEPPPIALAPAPRRRLDGAEPPNERELDAGASARLPVRTMLARLDADQAPSIATAAFALAGAVTDPRGRIRGEGLRLLVSWLGDGRVRPIRPLDERQLFDVITGG